MSGEVYWLYTPSGRRPLPGTFRPSALAPTAVTRTLVRARGYRQIYDLSDGLPDPVPITLTGEVEFETEAELSLWLRELANDLRAATAYDRDGRDAVPLLAASPPLAVPSDSSHSGWAVVTLTLVPAEVPDPAGTGEFW